MNNALTIGGPGTEHIVWESAHRFFERRSADEVERIAQFMTMNPAKAQRPGKHPLMSFVSTPAAAE